MVYSDQEAWYLVEMVLLVGFYSIPIAFLAFWVWMVIDCVKHEPTEGNDKLIWILILMFMNCLGALIYYIFRRRERNLLAAAAQKHD